MRGREWTDEEVERLRRLYPLHGQCWEGWADELPGRTFVAIRKRAARMGIRTRSAWTDAERAVVLRALLGAAREVGRTPAACATMALGIIREERERRLRG